MKKHGKSPAVGEGLLCAKSRPDGAPTLDNTIAGLVDLDANGLCLQWRNHLGGTPISRNPDLLKQTSEWFKGWGIATVFFGRFFGPMRAAVPLVAGVLGMPRTKFQIANLASALIWAGAILTPGSLGLRWLLT